MSPRKRGNTNMRGGRRWGLSGDENNEAEVGDVPGFCNY
jgi:hypothetical protein